MAADGLNTTCVMLVQDAHQGIHSKRANIHVRPPIFGATLSHRGERLQNEEPELLDAWADVLACWVATYRVSRFNRLMRGKAGAYVRAPGAGGKTSCRGAVCKAQCSGCLCWFAGWGAGRLRRWGRIQHAAPGSVACRWLSRAWEPTTGLVDSGLGVAVPSSSRLEALRLGNPPNHLKQRARCFLYLAQEGRIRL